MRVAPWRGVNIEYQADGRLLSDINYSEALVALVGSDISSGRGG